MSTGLKDELGLGEPQAQAQGSTEQADRFKAAFQAEKAKIDQCLQYTAAHAERQKHDPEAAKRDKTCSAYQVALGKIDPTNPAVAQGAIDQVLAAVQTVVSAVDTLKQAVEAAFNAWTSREGDLDAAADKIREMVEWGHGKAAALQQIIEAIANKANERKWNEALQGLEQLLPKLAPIYDEYQRQLAAQPEYEAGLSALEPQLAEASTCEFASLEGQQQNITSSQEQMRQAAEAKDFVTALDLLNALRQLVMDFINEVQQLRAKKDEYEQCRAALDPKLAEASTCQFQSLAELDQQIADLTGRMEEAAAAEDYEQALAIATELTQKVDEKITRTAEIEAAKQEYEQARSALDPKLAEASTCEFQSLAELDQQIADLTTQMEEAAGAEDYEQARDLANQLTGLVDEKLSRVAALAAAKEQYDQARAELDPRLGEASVSQYELLAELDQQIADLTGQMDQAAAAEEYEQALEIVTQLSPLVEEKLSRVAEIDAAKEKYEQLRTQLDPRLGEASTSEHAMLAELDQQIASLTTQMEEAAAAENYEQALESAELLSQKVDEKLTRVAEIEAAKEQYTQGRAALEPQLAQASSSEHESLADLNQAIAGLMTQMEAAVSNENWEHALQLLQALAAKVAEKLAEAARIDRKIIGSAQKARADKKLAALSEEDRKRFNKLADEAKSPAELDYLTKSLAANHSMDDIEAFAKKINGKNEEWMQNNLRLTGQTDGKGIKQQWKHSCNATTAQAVRGELDPIYALELREENKDVTDVDRNDATRINPKLAATQKTMLESEYKGGVSGGTKGTAVNVGARGGSGRWGDDLMNNMSDATGVEFANKKITGSYSVDDAVADVDNGLKKGHPVPLVVGTSPTNYQHYVLVTDRDAGPPATWTIHDPASGTTVKRNVDDIKNNRLNVANCNQISALDNPSAK